ncbi:MAG: hypothetical protein Q7J25_12265 [Vicinamibacterales bacterium]|nr:hypothetical protein [Vicinamibacterales bacterium]
MKAKDEIEAALKGEGCLGHSAPDEPVFILCARDVLAANHVREWADEVERKVHALGELTARRQAKIASARALAKEMDEWRAAHAGGVLPGADR